MIYKLPEDKFLKDDLEDNTGVEVATLRADNPRPSLMGSRVREDTWLGDGWYSAERRSRSVSNTTLTSKVSLSTFSLYLGTSRTEAFLTRAFLLVFNFFKIGVFTSKFCLEKEEKRPGWLEESVEMSSDKSGVLNRLQ